MANPVVGWFAAFIGAIGFGSFAVPIKGEAANSVDIDPLVMQSYKSLVCFLTSWLVILLGQEVTFTPWGIVSGLFWVPGGTFNIFAIRNAGLAISQGVVAATIVLVSFIWGNLIFGEPVKSEVIACESVLIMMVGLFGMSYYSTPESEGTAEFIKVNIEEDAEDVTRKKIDSPINKDDDSNEDTRMKLPLQSTPAKRPPSLQSWQKMSKTTLEPLEIEEKGEVKSSSSRSIIILGKRYSRRNVGLLSAVMCGIWSGSCLVPMHYSKGNTNGLGFVISFSCGALLVTAILWIIRFSCQLFQSGSSKQAYESLPGFHFRVMWLPGAMAGSLWSFGNVGNIVAVQHLGQGAGTSAAQAALFIAGLWGIFYFKEVKKPSVIGKWFISASMTIIGIVLLGHESSPTSIGR
eukprot:CAMPEP_0194238394 /NCGR_PEP_ID=MMETSP0158-20130606/5156_1 /TAXON_ID=33649 /ORGANISM="Thalassionema nitzschioides, Strain L26-B" /LENGTH=404 /DNA_ID=CAMNT_0038972635 /DNA_START=9 /DNA_END=1223 /DNA_ORIENTATION=+